ncbi:MAG: hypothetical protein ACLQME_01460 [Alphaproteobacteria bacterium]
MSFGDFLFRERPEPRLDGRIIDETLAEIGGVGIAARLRPGPLPHEVVASSFGLLMRRLAPAFPGRAAA